MISVLAAPFFRRKGDTECRTWAIILARLVVGTLAACGGLSAAHASTQDLNGSRATAVGLMQPSSPILLSQSAGPARAWSLSDSLELRRYADQFDHGWLVDDGAVATFSPGNSRFFVMTTEARLSCDCNVANLLVFDVDAVRLRLDSGGPPPEPIAALSFRSRSALFLPIRRARWIDDDNLAFIGAQPDTDVGDVSQPTSQIYTIDLVRNELVQRSQLEPLTLEGRAEFENWIQRFVATSRNLLFVTSTEKPRKPPAYPFTLMDTIDIRDLGGARNVDLVEVLHIVSADGHYTIEPSGLRGSRSDQVILPDALPLDTQDAIVAYRSSAVPAGWREYDAIARYTGNARFYRISFSTGRSEPLSEAPLGTATRMGAAAAARSDHPLPPRILFSDASNAVLVNAALPPSLAGQEAGSTAYIVSYSLATRRSAPILPLSGPLGEIRSVRLGEDGRCMTVLLEQDGRRAPRLFRRSGDRWTAASACSSTPPARPFEVLPEQDANSPPALVARHGETRTTVIPPDPRLDSVRVSPMTEISWTEADGNVVSGGLRLPADRSPVALPLVILNYYYRPDRFSPDGVFPSFSAQAFLSAGMAVLEIDAAFVDRTNLMGTPEEGPAMSDRLDAIVTSLASRGVIDPTRVGMFGFSRGGYNTRYVAFFPKTVRLAAAIADDAHDPNFQSYLFYLQRSGANQEEVLGAHGGQHFWQDKAAWLRDTTTFNYEVLRTPVLEVLHSGGQAHTNFGFNALEASAAVQAIGAPIQLAHFPYTMHQPLRPLERQALFDLSVVWMRFWLQDYEDPRPEYQAAYLRWREMRRNLEARSDPAEGSVAP